MLLDEIKLPIQKRSKQRLEKVLEQTILLIEEKGIEHCTIPEIAFRAEVPKIYIYQYFPTINHIFIVLMQRYLTRLQAKILESSSYYQSISIALLIKTLIDHVADFYQNNKVASILILGGPVHVDGFNLQEIVIEEISKQLLDLLEHHPQPLNFKNPKELLYLVEMVFALMKHSFYKHQTITQEIKTEAMLICDLYLKAKGHQIE